MKQKTIGILLAVLAIALFIASNSKAFASDFTYAAMRMNFETQCTIDEVMSDKCISPTGFIVVLEKCDKNCRDKTEKLVGAALLKKNSPYCERKSAIMEWGEPVNDLRMNCGAALFVKCIDLQP